MHASSKIGACSHVRAGNAVLRVWALALPFRVRAPQMGAASSVAAIPDTLTKEQAAYINVPVGGPYKPAAYRY